MFDETGFDLVWSVQNDDSGLTLFVDETQEGAALASVEDGNSPQVFYLSKSIPQVPADVVRVVHHAVV